MMSCISFLSGVVAGKEPAPGLNGGTSVGAVAFMNSSGGIGHKKKAEFARSAFSNEKILVTAADSEAKRIRRR